MFFHCKPRLTSLFPLKARQQADPSEGGFAKIAPSSPFFFSIGSLVGLDIFFNLGGGTPWVVTTSGLLPDDTGIQWDISKFGGTKPVLSILYNSSESNIQINICLFQL